MVTTKLLRNESYLKRSNRKAIQGGVPPPPSNRNRDLVQAIKIKNFYGGTFSKVVLGLP
jgi:hypothetical protein